MAEKIWQIKVVPKSKTNQIVEQTNDFLKIKLTAPAVEGKANKALISFLSKYFKISKNRMEIISGAKSRVKKIKIIL